MSEAQRTLSEATDLPSRMELGVDALDRGDAEGAALAFAAAVAGATPSDDRILAERAAYGAAEALLRLERDDEAAEYLEIAANSADQELRFLALRRRAMEEVRRGELPVALATYRQAEGSAPNSDARAEIASRIGWLTKETGGSSLRSQAAFRRARGVPAGAWVPRALLAVTIVLSVITKLDPALAELFALTKIDLNGSDYLTGYPWRLVTVAFVHGGIDPDWQSWALHLGFNAIALDIAASDFGQGGRYTLGLERRELDSDGLIELLLRWCERFPIASIEDPLAEDDPAAFARFTAAVGHRMQVVGDDFLVSDAALLRQAAAAGAANTVLLKPNQRGTLSETLQCWQAAQDAGYAAIVSARSGETEDTTIVDLAIGWQVGQLKVGSFARSERMAKWNEVLRIEEVAGTAARFAGAGVFGRSATRLNR